MDALFAEMLATLQEARRVVEDELQTLAQARFLDRDRLARVEVSAREYEEQADALAKMMSSRDAPEPLVDEAEDLFDYFRQIEERAEAIIEAGINEAEEGQRLR
jgi:Asp-tRNA(Asn)/Glu-tRNA(Gln) amidotransferase C subunit